MSLIFHLCVLLDWEAILYSFSFSTGCRTIKISTNTTKKQRQNKSIIYRKGDSRNSMKSHVALKSRANGPNMTTITNAVHLTSRTTKKR